MGTEAKDEALLVRYLLGELSEDEHAQVEDRFFTDQEFFGLLQMVKGELIDAYLRGELSEPERGQFEQRFLKTPRRQREVAVARALMKTLANAAAEESLGAEEQERLGAGEQECLGAEEQRSKGEIISAAPQPPGPSVPHLPGCN